MIVTVFVDVCRDAWRTSIVLVELFIIRSLVANNLVRKLES